MNISNYFYTIRNLIEIKRYQNKISLAPRSIAEHKFGYSKILYILCYWERKLGQKIDIGKAMEYAILSNTIKAITGDIQNNTMHATPNMKSTIEKTYEMFFENSYKKLLPEFIAKDIKPKVLYYTDQSIEISLIKASSLIDRLFECFDEISLGNTFKFKLVLEDTVESLLDTDLISIKLFLSELPNDITQHLDSLKDKLNANKKYVYNNVSSKDIFEFSDTFFSYSLEIRGLMDVLRYQNIFKHRERSVASHQWFVSLLALFLYYYSKEYTTQKIDLEKLLVKALFHDDIELYTGDIISGTKNSIPNVRIEIEKVESIYYKDYYSKLIPNDLNEVIREEVLNPKSNCIEGTILSISDILDTVYESGEEIQLSNLENFLTIKETSLERLSNYHAEFPFLKYFIPNNK